MFKKTKAAKIKPTIIFRGEIKSCMPKNEREAIGSHIKGARITRALVRGLSTIKKEKPLTVNDKCSMLTRYSKIKATPAIAPESRDFLLLNIILVFAINFIFFFPAF